MKFTPQGFEKRAVTQMHEAHRAAAPVDGYFIADDKFADNLAVRI